MENIDFLPERIHVQRARRECLVRQGYLLALCALTVGGMMFVWQERVSNAEVQLALMCSRVENVHRQLAMRSSMEEQLCELMVKKRINDQLGSRVDTLDVLSELQDLLPASVALVDLNIETMELRVPVHRAVGGVRAPVRPPGPAGKQNYNTVKRVRLVITGLAPTDVDVANFIGQLSASPIFEDVNMGYAKNVDFRGRKARRFQASCYVIR